MPDDRQSRVRPAHARAVDPAQPAPRRTAPGLSGTHLAAQIVIEMLGPQSVTSGVGGTVRRYAPVEPRGEMVRDAPPFAAALARTAPPIPSHPRRRPMATHPKRSHRAFHGPLTQDALARAV